MPKVTIATPIHGDSVKRQYCSCVIDTIYDLAAHSIPSTYIWMTGANVAEQRDMLADRFLQSDSTHLLFVDYDMAFQADLCRTMLALNRDVIGATYVSRSFDMQGMRAAFEAGKPFNQAWARGHSFHIVAIDNKFTLLADGTVELAALGAGYLLIARQAFERISSAGKIESYRCSAPRFRDKTVRGFFKEITLPDGTHFSEDFAFCRRWREVGGKVFGYNAPVRHVGDIEYAALLSDLIASAQK